MWFLILYMCLVRFDFYYMEILVCKWFIWKIVITGGKKVSVLVYVFISNRKYNSLE